MKAERTAAEAVASEAVTVSKTEPVPKTKSAVAEAMVKADATVMKAMVKAAMVKAAVMKTSVVEAAVMKAPVEATSVGRTGDGDAGKGCSDQRHLTDRRHREILHVIPALYCIQRIWITNAG